MTYFIRTKFCDGSRSIDGVPTRNDGIAQARRIFADSDEAVMIQVLDSEGFVIVTVDRSGCTHEPS